MLNEQSDDGGMPTVIQNTYPSTAVSVPPAGFDRWFREEKHKLEHQKRVQELELQQVMECLVCRI